MRFINTRGFLPEFIRFILIGGINTLSSYGIYALLLWFWSYPIAYTVAYVIAIFISYYLNTVFVFKRRVRLTKALRFPLVYLAQYLIGLLTLYVLVELLAISPFVAPMLVVLLTIPVTYILSRFIIKGHSSDYAHEGRQ